MAHIALTPGWALYFRVSTEDRQQPENSIPAQRRAVMAQLVQPSGLPVIQEYVDLESGKTQAQRERFQDMLEDATDGHFSRVGVHKWDRFGRNLLQALQAEQRLAELGIAVCAASMAGVDTQTPGGWLTKAVQQVIAEWDNRNRSEDTKSRMMERLRRGEWLWVAPLGYKWVREYINPKKARRWLELDEHAEMVRFVFERYAQGSYTLRTLADELTAEGYRQAQGGEWTPQGVRRVLSNEFYAGWCVAPKWGMRARGQHPPLVKQETWDACQEAMKRQLLKPQSRRHVYPLGRVLWSHEGKCRMYCTTCKGERCGWIRYYYSKRKVDGGRIYVQARTVEAQIPELLRRIMVNRTDQERLRREYRQEVRQQMAEQWEREQRRLKDQAGRLANEKTNLLRMATKGIIDDDEFAETRAQIDLELSNVRARLEQLDRGMAAQVDRMDQALELLGQAGQLWPVLSSHDQRSLAELIFERIHIDQEGRVLHAQLWPPLAWIVARKERDGSKTDRKGTPGRIRTCDLSVRSAALYPLSYGGTFWIVLDDVRRGDWDSNPGRRFLAPSTA
jgi:site-specific DNA recombinase